MRGSDRQSAADKAVEWFVLLRDDEATDGDRKAFERWLAKDPSHEAAWTSVERMWGRLDSLSARAAALQSPKPPRSRRLKRAAAAVALVMLAAAGWQAVPVGLFADHRTAVGERRTVVLTDGTRVELGTASALDVSFTEQERRVGLLSGQAFFTVTKDAARPFVVTASNGEVRVLGTAFDVKISENVAVTVAQSAVQVSVGAAPPTVVTEGYGVQFDARGVSAVSAADLEAVQAWRQGQLVFRNVALSAVVAELQRYHPGRIAMFGGATGQRRVTAVIDAQNIDAALDTIARSFALRVYRAGRFLTVIVPDGAAEK